MQHRTMPRQIAEQHQIAGHRAAQHPTAQHPTAQHWYQAGSEPSQAAQSRTARHRILHWYQAGPQPGVVVLPRSGMDADPQAPCHSRDGPGTAPPGDLGLAGSCGCPLASRVAAHLRRCRADPRRQPSRSHRPGPGSQSGPMRQSGRSRQSGPMRQSGRSRQSGPIRWSSRTHWSVPRRWAVPTCRVAPGCHPARHPPLPGSCHRHRRVQLRANLPALRRYQPGRSRGWRRSGPCHRISQHPPGRCLHRTGLHRTGLHQTGLHQTGLHRRRRRDRRHRYGRFADAAPLPRSPPYLPVGATLMPPAVRLAVPATAPPGGTSCGLAASPCCAHTVFQTAPWIQTAPAFPVTPVFHVTPGIRPRPASGHRPGSR